MFHKNDQRIFLFLTIVLACFGACKTGSKTIADSDLKFGHLNEWSKKTIATVGPGETVYICDAGAGEKASTLLKQALDEWVNATQMNGGLSTEINCDVDPLLPSISAQMFNCGNPNNWAETVANGKRKWIVRFCRNEARTYDFALHEVGHIFGQCDRYSDSINLLHPSKGLNCSNDGAGSDGIFTVKSAMQAGGPGHPLKVTLDDVNGVSGLLNRNDITGSGLWRMWISENASLLDLKSQFITTESNNEISLYAYTNRPVKTIELIDGGELVAFNERRQPQKTWPDIRSTKGDRKWRNAKDIELRVTRLDGKKQDVLVPVTHW